MESTPFAYRSLAVGCLRSSTSDPHPHLKLVVNSWPKVASSGCVEIRAKAMTRLVAGRTNVHGALIQLPERIRGECRMAVLARLLSER